MERNQESAEWVKRIKGHISLSINQVPKWKTEEKDWKEKEERQSGGLWHPKLKRTGNDLGSGGKVESAMKTKHEYYLIRSGSRAGEELSGLSSFRTAVEMEADLTWPLTLVSVALTRHPPSSQDEEYVRERVEEKDAVRIGKIKYHKRHTQLNEKRDYGCILKLQPTGSKSPVGLIWMGT